MLYMVSSFSKGLTSQVEAVGDKGLSNLCLAPVVGGVSPRTVFTAHEAQDFLPKRPSEPHKSPRPRSSLRCASLLWGSLFGAIAGFQLNKEARGVCLEHIPQRMRNLQPGERRFLLSPGKVG